MRSSAQDVVLLAHTVQAEGIGGWESCGGALTNSQPRAWFVRERYQTEWLKVFHMTKRIICLHPSLWFYVSERKFLPVLCCQNCRKSEWCCKV